MNEALRTFLGVVFIFTVCAVVLFPIVDFIIGKEVGVQSFVEGLISGIMIGILLGVLGLIKNMKK